MKKMLLIFVLIIGFEFIVDAQSIDIIQGTITDREKKPLPYTYIKISYGDTVNYGTISDIDGKYELQIPDSINYFTLEYHNMGYISLVHRICRKQELNKD